MTDFLINFGSNAALVVAQMRQLEAQALRTQAVINQTSAASARTAAAGGGGPAALGGLTAAGVASVSPQVDRLTRSLGGLQSQMRATASLGIAPTLAQTRREMTLLQQIAAAGGPAFGRFNSGASAAAAAVNGQLNPAAAQSAKELIQQRAALDSTSQAFQRHVGRIQETVLVYAALAAAAAGVTSAVSLATTIDTESRRLEAVLGFNEQQGREFVSGIFDTAVGTATPVEELLAESDFVASAFANVSDAAERERQSLELLNRVGQVTTVTQRDTAVETENLIAIMKLGGLSVEQLGTTLGQVTVAGNNSSTAISAILEALQLSLPAAKLAGVTIEQLIALTGLFRQETQRSGSVIGSTFATLFQTITNEKAQNNIKEITDGLVDVRDEAGNLRPALEILLQVRALIDSGALDPAKLQDIFKAFAPPLNPGAAKDIAIIFDLLDQLPASLREVESASAGALDQLVGKLNSALGPQFKILIEETKKAFFDLFGQDIIDTGQGLINLMRTLGGVIGSLPADLIVTVGRFVAFAAAIKGVAFVMGSLLSLMGLGSLRLSSIGAAAAASAGGLSAMSVAAAGLQAVLGRLIPLAIAFAAIDFVTTALDSAQKIDALKKMGLSDSAAQLAVNAVPAMERDLQLRFGPAPADSEQTQNVAELNRQFGVGNNRTGFITEQEQENIARFLQAAAALEQMGESTPEALERMRQVVRDASNEFGATAITVSDLTAAAFENAEGTDEQADAMERYIQQALDAANATVNMTAQERIAADTARLLEFTREKQASDLEKLADRLRTGKISAEEFAQGQQLVAQAADLAAQLVAVAGDRLDEYPLFAAAAAEGEEALTQAVYDQIVASGGSINAIGGLIQQLGNLAATNAAVASSLASNPLVIRMAISKVSSADLASNPELSAARRYAQQATGASVSNPNGIAAANRQAQAILDSFNNLVSGFGTGTSAFGNVPKLSGGGSSTAPQGPSPSLVDLEDFPAEKLAQAIALAQRLQSSIPGASAEAKDEVLNIIKDAQFLRQIKGLDDTLLRKAIEELTDIEKARLEEEKRRNAANELLSNLQVNAGPLGALISQPILFGVGGSIPAGLNYDPQKGGFTVNVDFSNFGSLTDQQLQQRIHTTIRDAIRDGMRLQGVQ